MPRRDLPFDRSPRFRWWALPLLLPLAAAGASGAASGLQERAVVSSEVAVASGETALRLEFIDGGRLEVVFRNGEVLLDGRAVGRYTRGDPLDRSWRALLGRAVSLDNGPLVRALLDWTPPAGLEGEALALAELLDRTLSEHLEAPGRREASDPETSVLTALLSRPELLPGLAEALRGLDLSGVRLLAGDGPVEIPAGEVLAGPLLVVGGDVDVGGTLEGDLVVAAGSLRLRSGGEIRGDVRLVDARLFRDGGRITGEVRTVEAPAAAPAPDLDRLRSELREEIRRELRASGATDRQRSARGPIRNLARAMGKVFQNLLVVVLLSIAGWVVVHFIPDRVRTVSEAARENPFRAAAVGLAGGFLAVPVWILGMLTLVISLVGILALPFWIVLFPLAVASLAFLGFLAVASNVGEWVGQRRVQGLERIRTSNLFHTVPVGIAALYLAFIIAALLGIGGPLTAALRILVTAAGVLGLVAATAVGLGAVLLTRAGSRPPGSAPFWGMGDDLDDGWDPFEGSRSRWQAHWEAERARRRRSAEGEESNPPSSGPSSGEGGEVQDREPSGGPGPDPSAASGPGREELRGDEDPGVRPA